MMPRQFPLAMLPMVLTLLLLRIPSAESAAETNTNTTVPAGLYLSLSDRPERITVDLKTNGVYTVLVTGLQTNRQSGLWTWDGTKQQFLLTPGTNTSTLAYEIRILRVDPRQEQTLQWIPSRGIGTMAGAIDYVRFKRKDD
jgi:hypothetical protein